MKPQSGRRRTTSLSSFVVLWLVCLTTCCGAKPRRVSKTTKAATSPSGCPILAKSYVSSLSRSSECCGTKKQPCASLQDALNVTSTTSGRIIVTPGTYTIPPSGLNLGTRSLSLSSSNPKKLVILDCAQGPCLFATCTPGTPGAVPCNKASLTMQGFSIQNGKAAKGNGGCLSVLNQALQLRHVYFQSCTAAAGNGGALSILSAPSVSLDDVTVTDSSSSIQLVPAVSPNTPATSGGGGIAIMVVASATLSRLTLSKNKALSASGGNLLITDSSASVLFSNLTLAQSGLGGGCAATSNSTVSFTNVTMANCQAVSGGCLADFTSDLSFTNCSFSQGNANSTEYCTGLSNCLDQTYGGCLAFTSSQSISITGSQLDSCQAAQTGGGINAQYHASLSISTSSFTNCYTDLQGAGMAVQAGPLTLSDCNITGNTISSFNPIGGGIYLGAANANITRCNISGNDVTLQTNPAAKAQLSQGAGLYVSGDPTATVTNTVNVISTLFSNNHAISGAGAYSDSLSPITFIDSNFTSNIAIILETNSTYASGTGAGVQVWGEATFLGCNFVDNRALQTAGAASIQGQPTVLFVNTTFINNTALTQDGGAIGIPSGVESTDARFKNCTFVNNTAPQGNGGAISFQGTALRISSSVFQNNTCLFKGGALDAIGTVQLPPSPSSSSSAAGVISPTVADIRGTTFSENSAPLGGGAIHLASGAVVKVQGSFLLSNEANSGGAVLVEDGSVLFLNETLCQGNNASLAGGCIAGGDSSNLHISSSQLDSNTGGDAGGAVEISGSASLQLSNGSSLFNNSALGGGAIWAGFYSSATLSNSNFSSNSAVFYGGAVYLLHSAQAVLSSATISSNRASLGGACLVEDSASLTSLYSNLTSNSEHAVVVRGTASLSLLGGILSNNFVSLPGYTGGALWVSEGGFAELQMVSFAGNSADMGGAVASTLGGTVSALECSFFGNAAAHLGGALYAEDSSTLTVRRSNFSHNSADESGAGVAVTGRAHGDVSDSTFVENSAPASGAGIFLQRGPTGPQALALVAASSKLPSGGSSKLSLPEAASASSLSRQHSASSFWRSTSAQYSEWGAAILPHSSPLSTKAASAASASLFPTSLSHTSTSDTIPISTPSLKSSSSSSSSSASSLAFQDLVFSGLSFNGSHSESGQGAAFFDGSFLPSARANCTSCNGTTPADTIGGLPASITLMWQGLSSAQVAGPLPIMADLKIKIQNLSSTLYDATGQVAFSGYDAVVEVQPDPRISGDLRVTPQNGSAEIPTFSLTPFANTSANFSLSVTVSSPAGNFPSFSQAIQISFCPDGYYLDSTSFQCFLCPIGSWCAMGEGTQFCSDGTFTFYPGQSSSGSCSTCPPDQDSQNNNVVTCSQGNSTLEAGWWLDMTSLNTTPAVYVCDISSGCVGMTYEDPSTPQCDTGYDEVRLCSVCSFGYHQLLNACYQCNTSLTNLFPLWAVLIVLCWVITAIISVSFHSVSVFATEVQILAVLGALNLTYPDWVLKLVQLCTISLFDPALSAIGCHFDFTFEDSWLFTLTVAIIGIAFFSLSYLILRISRLALTKPSSSEDTQLDLAKNDAEGVPQRTRNPMENTAVRGLINWLDICYLPVCIRCFQAFYWYTFDINALAFAPTIPWGSPSSQLMFWIAIPAVVLSTFLWPLAFLGILVYAKTHKLLNAKRLRECLGGMLTRYEARYYWWHIVIFARRLYYAAIFVFLHNQPGLQMALLIPVQVIRLGIQFAAAPFTSNSHDILMSAFTIAETLFSISVTGRNFLLASDSFWLSQAGFIIAVALFCTAMSITFPYEAVNKYVEACKKIGVKKMWMQAQGGEGGSGEKNNLKDVEGVAGKVCPRMDPKVVADWFRPHVISQVLLLPDRDAERELLMRVCCQYEKVLIGRSQEKQNAKGEGATTTAAAAGAAGGEGEGGGGGGGEGESKDISSSLGDITWTNGLFKSQLFAALHQVVLGATVGSKLVAEVPLREDDVAAWAQELLDSGAEGTKGVDLTASRSLARFRRTSFGGPRGASFRKSLSKGSRRRRTMLRASSGVGAEHAAYPHQTSVGSGSSADRRSMELDSTSRRRPMFTEMPSIVDRDSSIREAVIEEGQEEESVMQPTAPSRPVSQQGSILKIPFQRSLSDDDVAEQVPTSESQQTARGAPLISTTSMRMIAPNVNLVDEKPEELWPPPLENKATWVVRHRVPSDSSGAPQGGQGGGGPGGGDWLEALLDSMGMSLSFQESFGQLTLVEKKSREHAMRRLFTSVHVVEILAWLSSPDCTMEDRKLFVELLSAVRDTVTVEVGKLTWAACTWNVIRLAGIRGMLPW